jgi:hypothetical protein
MKSRREDMYSASKQDCTGYRKTQNKNSIIIKEEQRKKNMKIRGQPPTIVWSG